MVSPMEAEMRDGTPVPIWAAYSVFDHTTRGAFLPDSLMYDKLVVPVPPADEPSEWERWEENSWEPTRQRELLAALGPLVKRVPWNGLRRGSWNDRYLTTRSSMSGVLKRSLAGELTANGLFDQFPAMAERVIATSPYRSLEELEEELRIHRLSELHPLPGSAVSAIVGREILLPKDVSRSEVELLREAVTVATGNADYQNARAALHQRLQVFSRGGITDAASLKLAIRQIDNACGDLEKAVRKRRIWVNAGRVFAFSQIVLGALAAPLSPVSIGLVVAGIGQFTTSEMLANPNDLKQRAPDVAMLLDAQKRLDLVV
jgi:hypothetical protein